jgi:hypothetical protein
MIPSIDFLLLKWIKGKKEKEDGKLNKKELTPAKDILFL